MTSKQLLLAALCCGCSLAAMSAELELNPGLWETTMTRTNPLTGQPIKETTTECVTAKSFDPSTMMQDADGCRLVNEDLNGDTLTFSMQCDMQGSQSTVDGTFQTDGQTGRGMMVIKVSAEGMNMTMNMDWTAVRIGDC